MKTITDKTAVDLIVANGVKVFSVSFVKRSTGEMRTGRFSYGPTIKKGLKGGDAAYSFADKNLLPVYAMAGDAARMDPEEENFRRSIPIEGMRTLTLGGDSYAILTTTEAPPKK